MTYEALITERHGPVGWIVFNRPEAGNAINATMFDELAQVWIDIDHDPAVRVIAVTGVGESFNIGPDVEALAREPERLRILRGQIRRVPHALHGAASASRQAGRCCSKWDLCRRRTPVRDGQRYCPVFVERKVP